MDGSGRGEGYVTKDSGKRSVYDSGMQRDTEEGKARFDLLFPLDIPFKAQMMTRFADLMARGAAKYDERNWEKARGIEEMARYRSSAMRHLVQWETGEEDEDHAAAVMFNLLAHETTKYRLRAGISEEIRLRGLKPLTQWADINLNNACGVHNAILKSNCLLVVGHGGLHQQKPNGPKWGPPSEGWREDHTPDLDPEMC